MTMFYGSKLDSSFSTTQEILDMINACMGEEVSYLREEDGESDAILCGFRTEMKQRQNTYVEDVCEGRRYPHRKTTIHKSATTHGSDIYIVYDLGMRYAQIFLAKDLNDYDPEFDRTEETEIGQNKIQYVTVDTDKTEFLDLFDPEDTERRVRKMVRKLRRSKRLLH